MEQCLDIQSYVARVPEMDRFFTVDELSANLDELVAQFPELARVRRVGTSKLGESIRMISSDTVEERLFVRLPASERTDRLRSSSILFPPVVRRRRTARGVRLHLAPHPIGRSDGTRLNEGWFGGPFTIRNYARHFYRPSSEQQVECDPFRFP